MHCAQIHFSRISPTERNSIYETSVTLELTAPEQCGLLRVDTLWYPSDTVNT